jgi:maltooligosyltrehalose trehalohydrolase
MNATAILNRSPRTNGQPLARRLPVGAELVPGGVHFRVWAPRRQRVEVVFERDAGPRRGLALPVTRLAPNGGGYFSGTVAAAGANDLYRFRLDGNDALYPDPASRFQPHGPHSASQVIDPTAFPWTDRGWHGTGPEGQVLYEMHIGTFTTEGTWAAATRELPALAELGVTALEVMPVAEFAGQFGWGYDGVNLFAPTHLYGTPDDFRRFVDRAHALGLGVLLDVVYNHFGPDGCYLREFSTDYFTDRYKNEWGEPINFDGENSGPVREFFLANAGYWVEEFHVDGLRLDATQQIFDATPEHILACVSRRVREAAHGKATLLVAENEPQDVRLVRPTAQGGYGLDALWNDDFHHSATVALTGHNEAYYTDYLGAPQEFISAAKYGYLYQGQWYRWQRKRRGTPGLRLPPAAFINFLQNHDQIANSGLGLRCHLLTSPGRYRALTALLLLMPGTPMLFQGQEFAASAPFYYFADHKPELAELVRRGRAESLTQFRSLALPGTQALLADPSDPQTFARCKLDLSEREQHAGPNALHRDLLRLRREDPVFHAPRSRGVDGAVLGAQAFVLRFFGDEEESDRLLLVNLGRDLHLDPAPEPLMAPPGGKRWAVRWSSESLRYGGSGTAPPDTETNWRLSGEAALVLIPEDHVEKDGDLGEGAVGQLL